MQQLDSKAVWIFFANLLFSWAVFVFALTFVIGDMFFDFEQSGVSLTLPAGLGWMITLFVPVAAFVCAKLVYHFWRYELIEHGFRKESGVIWKRYVTIPYERIQNVDIHRGILARLFGLSDLYIQTAGSSMASGAWGMQYAEGRLPGLSRKVAEELRDELVRRARSAKNQGL